MAHLGLSLDEDKLSCSICLDLLKDPVTIPCGHSYCMGCIKNHWNAEDPKSIYSCPQCRKAFIPKPILGKNTMLSELVEEMKKSGLQTAPQPQSFARPGDVACDFCTGVKLKATKSCLQCLASYCQLHLQPHYDSPTFQTHKLVEVSAKIQENICPRHNKVKEIFCRSDQQSICYLCSMEAHKGHDTVSAAAERANRQRELGPSRLKIQQRIQDREKDVKLLQTEVENINSSVDEAARESQTTFSHLIQLLEKRSSEVQQQIQSQQETEMGRVQELQDKLQQEITELRKKDAELEQLSRSEDHCQFLLRFPSLSALSPTTDTVSNKVRPLRYFEELMTAVSELTENLQDILSQDWTQVSEAELDALLSPTEPEPRPSLLAEPEPRPSLRAEPEPRPSLQAEPEPRSSPHPSLTRAESEHKPLPRPSLTRAESEHKPLPRPSLTRAESEHKPLPRPSLTRAESEPITSPRALLTRAESKVPEEPVYLTPDEAETLQPQPIYMTVEESGVLPSQPVYHNSQQSGSASPPVSLTPDECKARVAFLQYSCQITLDPNTVNRLLVLSGDNRRVSRAKRRQWYFNHPDRFSDRLQVLSRESLTGRCYWEVEWTGIVSIAVTYKNISRTGMISGFGDNNKSWALYCHNNKFIHNGVSTVLSGPQSSRVGVYLDHRGGVLSFYSVSETMTLLQMIQTTFTQPLHVGLCVGSGSAELLQLL
ncbi:tripartite motif-containing protein 16-like [Melanotaenia boesemani]|uniref:tripartite motif-containing protein 16-like n=1 Tax=Melanotaenia boesemani TaxID=1250792 RepID=UPI001C056609|nr:tripartite motif-containing protein 16-like [Melanotaenia boesemani]